MDGSATLTIVMSRTIISIPVHSTTRAVQRERSCMGLPLTNAPPSGLCRNDSGWRLVAVPCRRWPAGWAGHGWSGGQGGEGLVGEVAGGDGFDQVVDGAGEPPFGGGFGPAAYRELAESHVVFEVAVGGFGDVAALAVGGDSFGSGQPGGHGGGGLAAGGRAGGGT